MRCGAKSFYVEAELDGKKLTKAVNARTPAEVRKTIRKAYGEKTSVISVREKKKSSLTASSSI